jgi:hypothetical protein
LLLKIIMSQHNAEVKQQLWCRHMEHVGRDGINGIERGRMRMRMRIWRSETGWTVRRQG